VPFNRWDQLLEHWDSRLRRAFLEVVDLIKDEAHVGADLMRRLVKDWRPSCS